MRYWCGQFVAASGIAAALAGSHGPAASAPLDAATCARLKGEVAALEGQGVRTILAAGPGQAKSLPADKLQQVRQLIDLDGQLRFRCPLDAPFVVLREEPPEEPDQAAAGEPMVAPVAPKKPAPAKAAPQPKAAAPAKEAAAKSAVAKETSGQVVKPAAKAAAPQKAAEDAQAARSEGPAPAVQAAKPKPKPKADDAYRPPANSDGNGTPLNKQAPAAKAP